MLVRAGKEIRFTFLPKADIGVSHDTWINRTFGITNWLQALLRMGFRWIV